MNREKDKEKREVEGRLMVKFFTLQIKGSLQGLAEIISAFSPYFNI